MNKQRKADLLLVMITGFWGASYFLTDLCLETMPPLSLNAFRFLVAFAVLGYETMNRRPGNLPAATGAKGPVILGSITY